MFQKIIQKHQKINLDDLNIILLCLSTIIYFISTLYSKNILVLTLLYLISYELFYHIKKQKYIRFINSILPIIIFAYFLLGFIELNTLPFNILLLLRIIIKILLMIEYLFIIIIVIKDRKLKHIKSYKKYLRKHTFKELRKNMIYKFQKENLDYQKKYIIDNDIDITSDYYKVINDNLKDKTVNDLEEYVWLNYLRFYKNKRYNHRNIFDKLNIVFLLIHVIILLLAILLR